jgi:VWFA-related protein
MALISEESWASTSVVFRVVRLSFLLFLLAGTLIAQTSDSANTSENNPQSGSQGTAQSPAQAPTSAPAPSPQGTSTPSSTPTPTQSANVPTSTPAQEISSRDEVTTFKVKVNLVLVRAVVRDAKGKAIGSLRKEDFELFDNKKPQTITQFVMETPGSKAAATQEKAEKDAESESGSSLPPPVAPDHYVAYVFDDIHLVFGDLARVRDAAERHMNTLKPTDRAAIFTTSGQGTIDFTDDRAKLRGALQRLVPRPVARETTAGCPDVTFYMADLIQNQNDPQALQVATLDALHCMYNDDNRFMASAQATAQSTASQVLALGEQETRVTLSVLKDMIRHIATMPGVRTVLLLSPGFLAPRMDFDYGEIIDYALRSQVVISALDARGLYVVDPAGDISDPHPVPPQVAGQKVIYVTDAARADDDVLADLAYGTGGSFVKNNNDLDAGLQRIAAEPEYWYVLGFTPQNLKLDGRFHAIKVIVKNPPKLEVQARKGYYAPKHAADPNEEAKQEIEDALFSQEELHDLPVDLHTQFFKATDVDAKLAVLCHVDVDKMHFQHTGGRNANNLTIVSGLFDRNGKFITGNQKVLEMHLKDDTLANKLHSGITIRSSFDVKPGSYLVRLVVRDTEGQLAAANGAIEIP